MSCLLELDRGLCWDLTRTLLHLGWLGVVVVGMASMGNWLLRGATARWRYGWNFAAMLVLGGALPATFVWVRVSTPASLPAAERASLPAPCQASGAPNEVEPGVPVSVSAATSAAKPLEGTPLPLVERPRTDRLRDVLRGASPYVAVLYLLGVAVMLGKLGLAIRGGQRLKAACRPVRDAGLLWMVDRQARRLAMWFVPALAYCERVTVPVVVGTFRPVILLPMSMVSSLPPEQLVAVLSHELAHLRRYDHLWILVQRFVEAVLFFHPAARYLGRRVEHEREICCDDLVLAAGGDRMSYVQSLLRMAELRLAADPARAALAALAADGNRPSRLRQRIARLLGVPDQPTVRLTRSGWMAAVLALLLVSGVCLSPLLQASVQPPSQLPLPSWEQANGAEHRGFVGGETALGSRRSSGEDRMAFAIGQTGNHRATGEADARFLADRFVRALRRQTLPFLSEQQVQELGKELSDPLSQRLDRPLPAARREVLANAVEDYVRRNLRGEASWLERELPHWIATLQWELWIAACRPALDQQQRDRRSFQRQWIREFVRGLPAQSGLSADEVCTQLDHLWTDQLNPFFQEPLSEEDFAGLQAQVQSNCRSLGEVVGGLLRATIQIRLPSLLARWPVEQQGWVTLNTEWRLTVAKTEVEGKASAQAPWSGSLGRIYVLEPTSGVMEPLMPHREMGPVGPPSIRSPSMRLPSIGFPSTRLPSIGFPSGFGAPRTAIQMGEY